MTEEQVHLGVLTFLRTCLPSAAAATMTMAVKLAARAARHSDRTSEQALA